MLQQTEIFNKFFILKDNQLQMLISVSPHVYKNKIYVNTSQKITNIQPVLFPPPNSRDKLFKMFDVISDLIKQLERRILNGEKIDKQLVSDIDDTVLNLKKSFQEYIEIEKEKIENKKDVYDEQTYKFKISVINGMEQMVTKILNPGLLLNFLTNKKSADVISSYFENNDSNIPPELYEVFLYEIYENFAIGGYRLTNAPTIADRKIHFYLIHTHVYEKGGKLSRVIKNYFDIDINGKVSVYEVFRDFTKYINKYLMINGYPYIVSRPSDVKEVFLKLERFYKYFRNEILLPSDLTK